MTNITNPNREYSDFLMAFTRNADTSDVSKVIEEESVKQSIINILRTNYNELPPPHNPNFGSNVTGSLFENFYEVTSSIMEDNIRYAISSFEPRVEIEEIIVNSDDDSNGVDIYIKFSIINKLEPIEMNYFLKLAR